MIRSLTNIRNDRTLDTTVLKNYCFLRKITEKFSDYLRTHHFAVYSDNNPLTYILTNNKLDATAHRWVSSLEPYSFTIKYKPGTDNTAADGLSRRYEMEEANNTVKYQRWADTICEGFHNEPPQVAAITIHNTLLSGGQIHQILWQILIWKS